LEKEERKEERMRSRMRKCEICFAGRQGKDRRPLG